jgi:cob(I)alamin adenosyltransferase
LFSGERRPKSDPIFEALGTTDELSSAIGFAREFVNHSKINSELETIQCILQDLRSCVATPRDHSRESLLEKTKWNVNHLVDLELWIDNDSQLLPPLKNFILPVIQLLIHLINCFKSI